MKSFSVGIKILGGVVGLILLLGLLQGEEGIVGSIFEAIFTGWLKYIVRVFPQAHVAWPAASIAGGCLIVLLVGSHGFLCWLYGHVNSSAWRMGWSFSIAAMTLLLLLSGMAMMGVAHQTGWLITSPYRLTERRADWNCKSNMQQIGLAILLYAGDNGGQYPPDLPTLLAKEPELGVAVFICPSTDDQAASGPTTKEAADSLRLTHHCSYIYLGKGLKNTSPASQVVLVEPPGNHAGDGMNVLYGDGHVEWVDREQALAIFEKYGLNDRPDETQKERE